MSAPGLSVRPTADPAYRCFLPPFPGRAARTVRVEVLRSRPGGVRLPRQVFSSGEAWSAHGARGGRVVAGARAGGAPEWTASLGARRAVISLGEARLGRPGRRRVLENPLTYPLDQILLARYLGGEGVIVHGGAAVRRGRASLFAGPSGAGKTTLARLLDAAGWTVLSDDRVVIRRSAAGFAAWGTPWPGEGGYARNESAPLCGLFVLEKGAGDGVRPLAPAEALARLIPAVTVPWYDVDEMAGPLGLLEALLLSMQVSAFSFSPGPGAARALAEHLDAAL